MTERASPIYYMVGDLTNPAAEPFVVVRVDVRECKDGAVPAIVQSTHWTREEAQTECDRLSAGPAH